MYTRLLVKFSGELFGGNGECFSPENLRYIITETKKALESGVKMAIVVGGGNIFRGRIREEFGLSADCADQIGIQGTEVNALMLQEVFRASGVEAQAYTAISDGDFLSRYDVSVARAQMDSGRLVILAGGTGKVGFTTDTAAVVRAIDLGCEVVCKATMVDGVYDRDPGKIQRRGEEGEQAISDQRSAISGENTQQTQSTDGGEGGEGEREFRGQNLEFRGDHGEKQSGEREIQNSKLKMQSDRQNDMPKRFETLRYQDAIDQKLQVMDQAAFAMAMDAQLPIVVYKARQEDALLHIVQGKPVGTLVSGAVETSFVSSKHDTHNLSLSFSSALPAGELLKQLGKGFINTR